MAEEDRTVIWRRVLVFGVAAFATIGLASTAFASAPATGTGGFTPSGPPVTISTRSADGNTIVTQIQQFTDTGVISGSETDTVTFTFTPTGRSLFEPMWLSPAPWQAGRAH
jgi:hypothetical protein